MFWRIVAHCAGTRKKKLNSSWETIRCQQSTCSSGTLAQSYCRWRQNLGDPWWEYPQTRKDCECKAPGCERRVATVRKIGKLAYPASKCRQAVHQLPQCHPIPRSFRVGGTWRAKVYDAGPVWTQTGMHQMDQAVSSVCRCWGNVWRTDIMLVRPSVQIHPVCRPLRWLLLHPSLPPQLRLLQG